MPKNNDLNPIELPMALRFGEKPTTNFKNNLEAMKVTLMSAPSMDDLRKYLPQFALATWSENPDSNDKLSKRESDKIIREVLEGKALPTALETVNLVFRIEGISLQEVTHILRHRMASFSADCSGDKWWTHKDALVPNSIQNSKGIATSHSVDGEESFNTEGNFYNRYCTIVQLAKELYCDMIDSKQISIMDARYILPRCLSTFYYMRITLKDALAFIKQRIDKQIQPETDNWMAYLMWGCLLKQYPIMNGIINIHQPSYFYVKMARTGKATNLYFPDADSDSFEYNENDFIYQCTRDKLNGTDEGAENKFSKMLAAFDEWIKYQEKRNTEILEGEYSRDESLL